MLSKSVDSVGVTRPANASEADGRDMSDATYVRMTPRDQASGGSGRGISPGTGGSGPDSGRLAMTSRWEHESLALGAMTNLREHRAPMLSRAHRFFDG
jgi:hypothetical protein